TRNRGPRVSRASPSDSGPYDVPGESSGQLATEHDRRAVHEGCVHALAPGLEPPYAAREVVDELLLPRPDVVRVEHHEVGPASGPKRPPVGEPEQGGGDLRDLADALLERPHLAVEDPRPQEVRRPVGAVVPGEMGAAVGDADDHAGI